MATKKSMKDAAAAGTSVFDQLTKGTQNTNNVQDAYGARDTQNMKRFSLRLPEDLKAYLYRAAYRESSPEKMVSATQYLADIIRADMEHHEGKA